MLELFGYVRHTIESEYVVPVDNKKLIRAAIDGMLTSLDPHSGYLSPDDYKDLQETTNGAYGGLGLEVTSEDGAVKVVTPMDDTPAFRAGLQPGDFITAIDKQSVLGLPLSEADKKMRGAEGPSSQPRKHRRQLFSGAVPAAAARSSRRLRVLLRLRELCLRCPR